MSTDKVKQELEGLAKRYSLNAAGMLNSGAPEHAQTIAIVELLSNFDDDEAESHWETIMADSAGGMCRIMVFPIFKGMIL